MRPDDVTDLLGMLAAAYPNGPRVTAETAETWSTALVGTDETLATRTVARWIEHEERWPTLTTFLDAVRAERAFDRARTLLPGAADEEEAEPFEHDESRGKRAFALMHTIFQRAAKGDPMTEEEVIAAARQQRVVADPREVLSKCPDCQDHGHVETADGKVRPCGRCNFEAFTLWRDKHYRPNHSCAVCRPERQRRSA